MPEEVRELHREYTKRAGDQIRQHIEQSNAFHKNYDDLNISESSLSAVTARRLTIGDDKDNFFLL